MVEHAAHNGTNGSSSLPLLTAEVVKKIFGEYKLMVNAPASNG